MLALLLWASSLLGVLASRPSFDDGAVGSTLAFLGPGLDVDESKPPRLVVLSFDRPDSLKRLLDRINELHYGADAGHLQLTISIDCPSAGAKKETVENREKTVDVANAFNFLHGNKTVQAHPAHNGIVKQWVGAWAPDKDSTDTSPACLILEDDLYLSKHTWTWLRGALYAYGSHVDKIASFSLQRQYLVPASGSSKGAGPMPPSSKGHPFMYRQFATWGFFALRPTWIEFRKYMEANYVDGHPADLLFEGKEMLPSIWHKQAPGNMWSYWFIRFMQEKDLFSLYSDVGANVSLCSNFREKGLHFNGKAQGLDTPILENDTSALHEFAPYDQLVHLDWDAQPMKL